MSIHRHPAEDLLLDYASGAVSETDQLAMTMHLALCATCRESIDLLETAAGAFMGLGKYH